MDQTISILGQAVLILTFLVCVVWLLFLLLIAIRKIARVTGEIHESVVDRPQVLSANGKVEHPEQEIFGA
jgi:hypothetical protein